MARRVEMRAPETTWMVSARIGQCNAADRGPCSRQANRNAIHLVLYSEFGRYAINSIR